MNTLKKYDKLLKFMYDEFNKGNNASGHGERIQVLMNSFERISDGNRIGDAKKKIGTVSHFLRNGWIVAVDTLGNEITNPRRAFTIGRMQPTQRGREYLEEKKISTVTRVASAIAEVIGRFFKGRG